MPSMERSEERDSILGSVIPEFGQVESPLPLYGDAHSWALCSIYLMLLLLLHRKMSQLPLLLLLLQQV